MFSTHTGPSNDNIYINTLDRFNDILLSFLPPFFYSYFCRLKNTRLRFNENIISLALILSNKPPGDTSLSILLIVQGV